MTGIAPFFSPFLVIAAVTLIPVALRKGRPRWPWAALAAIYLVHVALFAHPTSAKWLYRFSSPVFAALALVVLPAIHLPSGRPRRVFSVVPAAFLALAVWSVAERYTGVDGFRWILIAPDALVLGVVSALVLAQPFLTLGAFRRLVKGTAFAVLIYGGFAFRQSYEDHRAMLERRRDERERIVSLSETTPVMVTTDRLTYLPGAPCRFSADGGYVQGCTLELLQRVAQVDYSRVSGGDPGENAELARALGALLAVVMLAFMTARWWCGWVCPLSTLGDLLGGARRLMGLPRVAPSRGFRVGFTAAGLSLGGITLAMARAYPSIDESGRFLGCRIPVYPFCKICPGAQVCPVASQGLAGVMPLPGFEWFFGFFRVAVIVLLAVYLVSFVAARRLWCRLCPIGLVTGVFNRGGLVSLGKDSLKCNRCGICAEACPVDIDIVRAEMLTDDVLTHHCQLCAKCVEVCPRDGCLSIKLAGAKVAESRYDAEVG